MKKYCKCGREINPKWNSTIYSKLCDSCQRIKDNKKKLEQVKTKSKTHYGTKKGKLSPKSLAMDSADLWFSRYIRIKYSCQIINGEVFCRCIVTGTIKLAKQMDNGHCFSRGNKLTRFEEDNCRPQNRSSNRFKGEQHHYRFKENLAKEIGQSRLDELFELTKGYGEDNEAYYREVAKKYRLLVNKLAKELGVKKWW